MCNANIEPINISGQSNIIKSTHRSDNENLLKRKTHNYSSYDDSHFIQQNCAQSIESNRQSYTQCASQSDQQFYASIATGLGYANKNLSHASYLAEKRFRNDGQEAKKYPYQERTCFEQNTARYESNANNLSFCLSQQNANHVQASNIRDHHMNEIVTATVDKKADAALTLRYPTGSAESYSCSAQTKQYDA